MRERTERTRELTELIRGIGPRRHTGTSAATRQGPKSSGAQVLALLQASGFSEMCVGKSWNGDGWSSARLQTFFQACRARVNMSLNFRYLKLLFPRNSMSDVKAKSWTSLFAKGQSQGSCDQTSSEGAKAGGPRTWRVTASHALQPSGSCLELESGESGLAPWSRKSSKAGSCHSPCIHLLLTSWH